MVKQHHGPKYSCELRCVIYVLFVFEQADKHIFQPVVIDFLIADELLEDFDDAFRREFSKTAFHQFEEFLLCFW